VVEDPFRKHQTSRGQGPCKQPADGNSRIFNRHQTETAGSNRGKVEGAGSPEIIGAVNRSSKEKGDSTLARGAKSDLIYEDRRVESDDVAALAISQCKGYLSKDVVSRQELVINYVERDLLIRTHIPLILGR
jgi:hypothetical protein